MEILGVDAVKEPLSVKSSPGATAKDLVLALITQVGTGGGQGHIVEYRGEAIRALSMEGRMTLCNMSIEAGARAGMVAPDETTFSYIEGRRFAPDGNEWEKIDGGRQDEHERRLPGSRSRWERNREQRVFVDLPRNRSGREDEAARGSPDRGSVGRSGH